MTKSELRKLYLQKRKDLSEATYVQMSRQLCDSFFTYIDISFIKTIHCFLPIVEKHEPNTWLIIERIRREFSHIRISLPKIEEDGSMTNIYFEGLHQLVTSKWNILEPRHGVPTPTGKIDLIIVPLLCFDYSGHRVGYGKGYYDSLLKTCRPDAKKIGLTLFDTPEKIDDLHEADQRLTACLTPTKYFTF